MKNKAVFLDRDGVIIHEKHHLREIAQVEFISSAAAAIKKLNSKFIVIVISNQAVVARKLCTEQDVKKVNQFIQTELEKQGAKIDAFYFCPHHPKFSGDCECRKPKIGMLVQAKKDFNLNFANTFFVGDKTVDIQTGKNAGCKTILVKTGYAGSDKEFNVQPDITAEDILDAVEKILKTN
ncbi:MAG: HAD family hydrolase [Candidatus Diapherotrites archaeon]|nr:HAD family hydrolase [Candidatus Diapherotrites archaeon]